MEAERHTLRVYTVSGDPPQPHLCVLVDATLDVGAELRAQHEVDLPLQACIEVLRDVHDRVRASFSTSLVGSVLVCEVTARSLVTSILPVHLSLASRAWLLSSQGLPARGVLPLPPASAATSPREEEHAPQEEASPPPDDESPEVATREAPEQRAERRMRILWRQEHDRNDLVNIKVGPLVEYLRWFITLYSERFTERVAKELEMAGGFGISWAAVCTWYCEDAGIGYSKLKKHCMYTAIRLILGAPRTVTVHRASLGGAPHERMALLHFERTRSTSTRNNATIEYYPTLPLPEVAFPSAIVHGLLLLIRTLHEEVLPEDVLLLLTERQSTPPRGVKAAKK